ncbi:MAG: alpha/beta hydrolase [Opitutaceae bacterium]
MKTSLCLAVLIFAGLSGIARAAHQTDIEYGNAGGESLKLDAYVPDGPGPFPTVILVHGGGWNGGDKSGGPKKGYMAPMHEPLEKAGYAWFSINYRLAPKHQYPANIEDVETAIRWVKANAAKYHLDPQRIALSGESAGGHLIQLAAVRATADTRVAAVIPFYGRCSLVDDVQPGGELRANLAQLFGRKTFDDAAQKMMREASPLLHVKRGLPPFLLVHGTADQSVPYQQSLDWQARMKELGMTCDLITIKEGVHGMISWDAVAPTYKQDVVAWLDRTLKINPAKASR